MFNGTALHSKLWFWLTMAVLFLLFIYGIRAILLPFVIGLLTAYFLDPVVDKLEEWGSGRGTATLFVTAMFFIILAVLISAIAPVAIEQFAGLLAMLPEAVQHTQNYIQDRMRNLPFQLPRLDNSDYADIGMNLFGSAKSLGAKVLESGLQFINLVTLLVITPIVAFYLLRDWDCIVERIDSLLPRRHVETIRDLMRQIDTVLAGFIRGQLSVMAILGGFYAIALTIVGLKFGFIIGLLAGILIIIPYLGTTVGGVVSVGMALAQYDGFTMPLVVTGIFVFGQMVEGYFLVPRLVGDKVGLHPMWVIFGLLAGGALFGFVGVLLALPLTAIAGVLVKFAIQRYRSSAYYSDVPKLVNPNA
jgi:predicted PurR-regulated permease PerM